MALRVTTNGMYKAYRTNLMTANNKLKDSMERVSTGHTFTTYAESPADASLAFRLRRSLWRMDDQMDNLTYLSNKFEVAYSALDAIVDGDADHPGLDGIMSVLRGLNDPTGTGRDSIASDILSKTDSIAAIMNSKYSNESVFAGADGHNTPFQWDGDKLLYRGVDVSAAEKSRDYAKLEAMSEEATYVDIGLGLNEDAEGNINPDSAFNSSISGLDVLGWGLDEDGDSMNMAVLLREVGRIFQRCDGDGNYASEEDEDRALTLITKLEQSFQDVQKEHVRISADANFVHNMHTQLKHASFTMTEQLEDLEQEDPALAITEMTWAQFCYQAALRIGQDILSESLFDYMQ